MHLTLEMIMAVVAIPPHKPRTNATFATKKDYSEEENNITITDILVLI
jgi:hypothetical protein